MHPLDKPLRKQLETTVKDARQLAERAARAALEQLGVAEATAFERLSESQKALRRRLRAHGRQLGDALNGGATQSMERLVEEVAYQHWHRMLFARFLAENGLLMYPDPDEPVAVSLEECEDMAADEGAANGWELAARYAARMLPRIFRADSPVFELGLAPEFQQGLERLVAGLDEAVFRASDSLGWVYQFWQADKKDRIDAAGEKIGADELPAVTQLFTEPYMVAFLLDNTLGAWWAARRLDEADWVGAESEAALREKAAIPGVTLTYLRFVREAAGEDGTPGRWAPASGRFEDWPARLDELRMLDPCCGSGHFLVGVLLMLVPMRMALEGLSAREAVDAVLRDNIHGLELDQRCVELAVFALAFAAWRYLGAGGYRVLPEMNVACCGLAVGAAREEWKQLGLGKRNLTIALDWLYDTFQDAPLLGSLLNPRRSDAARIVPWQELSETLQQALQQEPDETRYEAAVAAQGLARAALLLARQYQLVVTNVPYLARGKQSERLRQYCERHYPTSKTDLATVFLDRCLELCVEGGTASVVLPQNWLFLTSYRKFREKLLTNDTWNFVARLGPAAFDVMDWWAFNVALVTVSRGNTNGHSGDLFGGSDSESFICGLDVSKPRSITEKAAELLKADVRRVNQMQQLKNPDARIALDLETSGELLEKHAYSYEGLTTGDLDRFVRKSWEIQFSVNWHFYIQNTLEINHYSGRTDIIHWGKTGEVISGFSGSFVKGRDAWNFRGLRITQMRHLPVTIYSGEIFGKNAATLIPNDISHLPAIWCFCSSPEYHDAVRRIDQKLNVTNATLVKVPFDLDHWTEVAAAQYPNGLPHPYTNDPTQWIFHGHPCGAVVWDDTTKWTAHAPPRTDHTVLHIAVARLLGYRWPAELDADMELADEQRHWVTRCTPLLAHADDDGIVCIPAVRGEAPAAERLLDLLAAAYGDAWSNDILAQLLNNADHAGNTLETWLRDKFFAQHCKLFHHRPFIWHLWDGLRDGFSALVNYHRLDYKNLETLIYTYLGDWIARQKQDITNHIDGAAEKLAAAENLKRKLEQILLGESPHDIFVRWKPLADQPIGWHPDLNDGVRMNIRPFMAVADVRKKGAGVLATKPNIKWDKDRGKDVESAPWYHRFHGDRINDHHLTLAEKQAAREEAREQQAAD